MQTELEIIAEERGKLTKSQIEQKRKSGYIPGIAYGSGKENILLWIKYKTLVDITKSTTLEGTIFNLKVKDKSYPAIIKEIQKNLTTHKPIHVDFQLISMKEKIEIKVPIKLVGEETALKLTGGIVDFPIREVKVRCLPKDIPHEIVVDIANLKIGQAIHIKDIPQEKFTILEDQSAIVVHIISKKVEEVTPGTESAVAGPAEPEVIAKGKKVEEGATASTTSVASSAQKTSEKSSAKK